MWLLRTETPLRLVWFAHSRTLEYAILSHVWQANEVLFQDIRNGTAEVKVPGYEKVVGACARAKEDGFEYVWIDNCCIDKASSAELSESINSMWEWYCDARICYAYLSDVSGQCPELGDEEDDIADDDRGFQNPAAWPEFSRSKWFTRGWTLQELLAPENLVFYGQEWNRIGTKLDLLITLWTITGIDILALESRKDIFQFAVARKMSWAAGRETTRLEDRAYSLLGIFDINMPLLYGEGRKAFIRLQEEIIRSSSDHSIFAWELRDEEALPSDMLFAPDPDYFRSASRLVRGTAEKASSPFRLTAQGMQFDQLPVLEVGDRFFAFLRCCYEDDFRGPIALCIAQQDSQLTARLTSGSVPNNVFWFPDTAVRRLMICETHKADTGHVPSRGPITITRHNPVYQFRFLLLRDMLMIPKIQVTKAPGSGNFVILEGFPRRSWNTSTRVMCPNIRKKVPAEVTGGLLIEDTSGAAWNVAFRGSTKGNGMSLTGLAAEWLAGRVPFHLHISEVETASQGVPSCKLAPSKMSRSQPQDHMHMSPSAARGNTTSAPELFPSNEIQDAKQETTSVYSLLQVLEQKSAWSIGSASSGGASVSLAEVIQVRNEPVLSIKINLPPVGNGPVKSTEQRGRELDRRRPSKRYYREAVSRYRLTQDDLREWLRKRYSGESDVDFKIDFVHDELRFHTPAPLTEDDLDEIDDLRGGGLD